MSRNAPNTGSDGVELEERPAVSRPRRFRRSRQAATVVAVVALGVVGWSYGNYLRRPGNTPVSVTTVDWLRDHGFNSVVDTAESWAFRSPPPGKRPPVNDLPTLSRAAGPNEWKSVAGVGMPAGTVEQKYVQPTPSHPAVVLDVVRFDQHRTLARYVPGLVEPAGATSGWKGMVPASAQPRTVAAFNAGFRFINMRGGVYTRGQTLVPLVKGKASMVLRTDGTLDVGEWGRDLLPAANVVSVRQNLALIVSHGRAESDLGIDRHGKYGSSRTQFQHTWRSGIGVDAAGRLVFAAGRQVSLTELAAALVAGGAVRGMQLDIHQREVTFNWVQHPNATTVRPAKMMRSMTRSADRYLVPDQRDFVVLLSR